MGSDIVTGFWSQLGALGASHTVPFLQFVFCFNWEKSKLENTLLWIRPVCSDFEKKRERSDGEEKWLTTLRDICNEGRQLVYEIDEVQRQVDVSGNMAAKVLCFLSHLPFYSAMACKMKRIRERLNAAAEDYTKFPPLQQVEGSTDRRNETRETTSYLGHTEVIGREMDKKAIKTLIRESRYEKNVLIIPIIGIGGLGKTTLARLVYNDEEEDKNHFDLKIWVWVSTDFNMETLVKKVIAEGEGAATTAYSGLGMNQLQSSLRAKLDGKKYMLVLDDVWETNQLRWTPFRDLLMAGAKGSVILVTTRDKAVGRITSNTPDPGNPDEPYIYILKSLSEDNSWSLFKQEACQCKLEEKPQLRTVGEKILVECGGNPLAIKTVGSLLFGKGTLLKWLDVKNKLWEIDAGDTGILPSLKVSYDHLSFYLQKCFAHCALFPKGYIIKKSTLIQLWMAEEEYIQPEKKILEAGEDYFDTLLNQNFFEDERKDANGNITHCKMYDLIYYLAETVADNYSIIRIDDDDGARISKSVIHASISELPCQFPTSILTAKKLRTFISTVRPYRPIDIGTSTNVKRYTDISKEDFDNFALTFKSLRVLGLVCFCWWENFAGRRQNWKLQNIEKLKHLRYLDLSFSQISTLPNSVCMLRHLQTLKLSGCEALTELPGDIKKLKSLTHLENDDCPNLKGIPCGIGQLTCIRTLQLFVLGEGAGLSELETLNNLRGHLEIQILKSAATSVDFRKACLKEKEYLQTLTLSWRDRGDEGNGDEDAASLEALQLNPNLKGLTIDGYGGVRFPSWMLNMGNSLPYLVQITLSNCSRCVHFPRFADLSCLKELSLLDLDFLEYIDSYISDSFSTFSSSLKRVYLSNLPKLKEWTRVVNDGGNAKTEAVAEQPTQQLLSLCSLEKLSIVECPELTSMPLHPNVEELQLDDVSGVLIESMKTAATVSPTAASTSVLRSSFTFSKLKSLQIIRCKDLVSLGEGWLGNLTSLERLEIWNCPELNFSDEDNDMPVLTSLHSLKLSDLPKLAALPKVLRHSTALETLEIEKCPGLMTLPDWFGKLTSLRQLIISNCSELKSLPEGMRCLTALQRLRIWNCTHLSEKCRKKTGDDWPKIEHIPDIDT